MLINEAIDLISDEMRQVNDSFGDYLDSDIEFIGMVGDYIISGGGKRYRPLTLLLTAKLLGYEGTGHIPLAAMIEFIHTATLLHDDVVDNASLRRGNATVNSKWGEGASILVGDYLLAKSFAISVAGGEMEVLKVLSDTTTRMAEGEVLQLLKQSDPDTTEAEHLSVVTNKTAILFSTACRIGAIISNATREEEEAAASYGMDLGIAYQLADDSLDYISSNDDLGKETGNDLREGKVTLPLIKAFGDADRAERAKIREVVEAKELRDDDLREVFAIIEKYKGIEYAMDKASGYVARAKKSLEIFPPNVERSALMAVADYVTVRSS